MSALESRSDQDLHRTVVVPALDEVDAVPALAALASTVMADRVADRFVVVDGGSTDGTPERARAAGLEVLDATGLPPGPPVLGKGDSIWRVADLETDVVVFRDADVVGVGTVELAHLAEAVVAEGVALAKGRFVRLQHRDGPPREVSGRITEFVARPLLGLLTPELSLPEPLSGQFAVRAEVLASVPIVTRYGVDVGLALTVAELFGPSAVTTVDLGELTHRSKDDASLIPMAHDVAATVLGHALGHALGHDRGPAATTGLPERLTTTGEDAIMAGGWGAPGTGEEEVGAGVAGHTDDVRVVLPCAGPNGPLPVRPPRRTWLAGHAAAEAE